MRTIPQQLTLWVTGTVLVVSLGLLQMPLTRWSNSQPKLQQLTYLPSGDYLRIASLGYRELAADLLWLQAIQVMGSINFQRKPGAGSTTHWIVSRRSTRSSYVRTRQGVMHSVRLS